jgi:molecular chaperone GrpE
MSDEEEFEFEFEDDEEEEEKEKPRKSSTKKKKKTSTKKGSTQKKSSTLKKKTTSKKKKKVESESIESTVPAKRARKMPLSDGVKKRLLKNMKEISKLKDDLENCRDEKESFEREFELLEDELESLRSDNDKVENDLNQKIAVVNALEKKLDRSHKDFENFKKRSENEIDKKVKMGSKKIFLGIIDVLDNLDRALSESKKNEWRPDVKHVVEGIESIKKGLLKVLHDNGVELIDPIDEAFDPNYQEAIEMKTDKSKPDNTVISVETKGYILEGIVLRAAKVTVSKGGKPRPKKKEKKDKKSSSDAMVDEESEDSISDVEEMEDVDEEIEELDEIMEELDKLDEE